MTGPDIGFVGAGTIARVHAKYLQEAGGFAAAVADIDPSASAAFAEEFDVPETYEDYERMLAEAALDAVVVAVPNSLHAPVAVAALEADLDVLVEKPLAHDLASAERIAAAEAESEGRAMVGFVKAFETAFEDARRRVAAGELGRVYDAEAVWVRRRGVPQIGSWFTRNATAGGGVLIDAGVHVLHLLLYALDFPTVETVSATADAHFGDREDYTYLKMWGGDPVDDPTFDVEDTVRAVLRTADGTTLHLHVAWAANREAEQRIVLSGDEAGVTATIDGDGAHATRYGTDGDALTDTTLRHGPGSAWARQWEYFADVVGGEREHTRNTVTEGVAVQRTIDAIYESADRGREVTLADR